MEYSIRSQAISAVMENIFIKIWQWFWRKLMPFHQFIKFSLVGATNTVVDFILFYTLTRGIAWFSVHYLIANSVSFALAITNSYFLNHYWTFNKRDSEHDLIRYLKFILANVFTLIILQVCLYFLIEHWQVYDLYAKTMLVLISVVSNFFLSKFLVFKS